MKLKIHIILRRCSVFKSWSIDVLFPYDIRRRNQFLKFKDLKEGTAEFIGLKRKAIVRIINIKNLKIKK
jgi:hypothetical protein